MFGRKTEIEYGYRFKNKDKWCASKSEAEQAITRMNRNLKRGGTPAKLIQRTVKGNTKNTCRGGKCTKRGQVCKKHFRELTKGTTARGGQYTASEWSLENIHARWDEPGHRWS